MLIPLSEANRKSEGWTEEVERAREKEEVREARWKIKIESKVLSFSENHLVTLS